MQYLLDLVVSGLAIGAIYGLLAMGFACIYKATGVVNFGQGEMMMLITYITASVLARSSMVFWMGLVLAPVIGIAVGWVVERVIIRPMIGQPAFAIVMATIGMAVAMRSFTLLLWGSSPREFPGGVPSGLVRLGGVALYPAQLLSLALFIVAVVAAWAFLRWSRLGIAMRATAINERVTMLMGVDVRRVSALAWCGGAALSGIAGVLFAAVSYVGPGLFNLGLKAFPATILGGLDSMVGSGIGGLIIGVTENLVGGYIDSAWKEVAGFAVIILVLMLRPNGLFGDREVERV